MAKYNLETVEYIHDRANATYDEIIALLEAYEGDSARVLAELERQGKLKKGHAAGSDFGGIKGLIEKGYSHRVTVTKGTSTVANLSVIFAGISVIAAPWVTIPGAVVGLCLGYKFKVKHDPNFDFDVRAAATVAKETIKKTVGQFYEGEPKEAGAAAGPAGAASAGPAPEPAKAESSDGDEIVIE